MDRMEAISPVDGRYRRITEPLAPIFSEQGLNRYRVRVEGEYLIAASRDFPGPKKPRVLSDNEAVLVRSLYELPMEEAQIIKAIETRGYGSIRATNHDVKAVEYWMKEKLRGTSLADLTEWIHFALTSEDVNNIAYGLMLGDGLEKVLLPAAEELDGAIEGEAYRYRNVPMLARTHGQPASPTTFGKELKVFASRMRRQINHITTNPILVKLNGATGNYNAHAAAYPGYEWVDFSERFIGGLNNDRLVRLALNAVTTQIESHDTYAELFDSLRRLNTVVIDFDQDMWRYISDDWVKQKPVEGEVGSSTMPHKVNPIDFENSEGNLGMANVMFEYFSRKLPISRLQRDLSDSTVERNFGPAFAHTLIGYKSASKGMGKCALNEQAIAKVLESHPEVLSEAYQTILRREGADMPYEKLKELTRGRKVTMGDMRAFVDLLDVGEDVKEELRRLTPSTYTGFAARLIDY